MITFNLTHDLPLGILIPRLVLSRQSLPMSDIVLKAEKTKEILFFWRIGTAKNFSISFRCSLEISDFL
jgi:hypothetical protein